MYPGIAPSPHGNFLCLFYKFLSDRRSSRNKEFLHAIIYKFIFGCVYIFNTLTADDEYFRNKIENLTQPIQVYINF